MEIKVKKFTWGDVKTLDQLFKDIYAILKANLKMEKDKKGKEVLVLKDDIELTGAIIETLSPESIEKFLRCGLAEADKVDLNSMSVEEVEKIFNLIFEENRPFFGSYMGMKTGMLNMIQK